MIIDPDASFLAGAVTDLQGYRAAVASVLKAHKTEEARLLVKLKARYKAYIDAYRRHHAICKNQFENWTVFITRLANDATKKENARHDNMVNQIRVLERAAFILNDPLVTTFYTSPELCGILDSWKECIPNNDNQAKPESTIKNNK